RLEAVEEAADQRLGAGAGVRRRERPDDRRSGEDERGAAGEEARPARAAIAEMHRLLGGVRAGNQVRHAQEVEEALVTHPRPPRDDLLAHERDVGGRPAEADDIALMREEVVTRRKWVSDE